jgi:predicted house-cleaning noncanonical NTP pyrophosphatase (MazG superfamily)
MSNHDWQSLGQLLDEIAPWAEATFPREGTVQKLEHLFEEIKELIDSPDDLEEWADCFSLLFDAARKQGLSSTEIVTAMRAKFEKNKLRKWDDGGDNGVYHHVKENQ